MLPFLGGPLHFLSELKEAFIRTLNLDEEHTIAPENSHLFAAIGSALNSKEDSITYLSAYEAETFLLTLQMEFEVDRMQPLFDDQKLNMMNLSNRHSKTSGTK